MRTLNYDQYFSKGEKSISNMEDYNSHTAKKPDDEETIKMLEKIDFL